MSVYDDLMKQAKQEAVYTEYRKQQPVVGGGFSGGNKIYQDLMQEASSVGLTGGLSIKGREQEIYDALINPVSSQTATPQVRTNSKRDQLLKDLEAHRADSGWVTDDLSKAAYDQTEQKILADLADIDKQLGNEQQNYDRHNLGDRIGNTWAASASGQVAGVANAAGTFIDFGQSLNERSSEFDKALSDSDMAGWVTDDLSRELAQQVYEKGQLESNGRQEEVKAAAQKLYGVADNLQEQSSRFLEEAKYGTGKLGSFAVDVGKGLFDVAGDTLLSTAVPGLGMARMATSAFGSAAQEARHDGKSVDQQMFAGLKSATIEVVTEKIGGPFEKAYGKTMLGNATNKAIEKLSQNSAIKKFLLKTASNFLSEGGEEILSNLLNVGVDRIVEMHANGFFDTKKEIRALRDEWTAAAANGESTDGYAERFRALQRQLESQQAELSKVDWEEALYEFLVGGFTGMLGGFSESVTTSRFEAGVDRANANVEARVQAVKEGKAVDASGLIKNIPDRPLTTNEMFVEQRLSSLNEDTAREMVSNSLRPTVRNAYEQAIKDLTGIDLKGSSEDAKIKQLLDAAQEAAGAQEAPGNINTPPAPQTNDTQAPDVLNTNSREQEAPEPTNEPQNPTKSEAKLVGKRNGRDVYELSPDLYDAVIEAQRELARANDKATNTINGGLVDHQAMQAAKITYEDTLRELGLDPKASFRKQGAEKEAADRAVQKSVVYGKKGASSPGVDALVQEAQGEDNTELRDRLHQDKDEIESMLAEGERFHNQLGAERTVNAVVDLMASGKMSDAKKILNSEEYRKAYEALTGEKLPSNRSKAAEQIVKRSKSDNPLPTVGNLDVVDLLLGGNGQIARPAIQQEQQAAPAEPSLQEEQQSDTIAEKEPAAQEELPEQIPYEEATPIKKRDIQAGTRVVNKSGTNGVILATTQSKVYVKFDGDNSGNARIYSMDSFARHFRLAEVEAVENPVDGSIGEVSIDEILEEFRGEPAQVKGSEALTEIADKEEPAKERKEPKERKIRSAKDLARAAERLDTQRAQEILDEAGIDVDASDYDEMAEVIQEILDEYGISDSTYELSPEVLEEIRQRVSKLIDEEMARRKAFPKPAEAKAEVKAEEKSSREADEAFKEDVEHFRAVFEDQPVEKSKFINGQNTYGEYTARQRADILNAIYGDGAYYVRDGMVVSERTPTTTRAENPNDRTTNLPSNHKKPGKAKTETAKAPPVNVSVRFNDAAPLSDNDIKVGTLVVHKSNKGGRIVLISGNDVYVQFGNAENTPAEPFSRKNFKDFFRSTEAAEPEVKIYNPKGGQTDAVPEGRNARIRGADTGGHPEVQGAVARQDNGGTDGRSAAGLAQGVQRKNNQELRKDSGSEGLTQRRQDADKIQNKVLRKKVLQALDGIERGKLSQDEADFIFKQQWQYAKTRDDKLNLIKAAGGQVVETSKAIPAVRSAIENAQKRRPGTVAYVVDSDICEPAICGRDGTVYINQKTVVEKAQQFKATVQQVVDHEFVHADFRRLGINGEQAKKWLLGTFGNDSAVVKAINDAYNYHKNIAHKGDTDAGLWEEVACDFLSDNARVCADPKMFKTIETSLKQFMNIHETSAMLANGGKKANAKDTKFGDNEPLPISEEAEIEAMLNDMSAENAELERRERLRQQAEFDELRRQDKLQTNAKEWGQQQRAKAKAEKALDEMVPKHDPQRELGAEGYATLTKINRQLTKNVSTDDPKDVTKREFNKATYGAAEDAILSFMRFVNGRGTFAEFASEYENLKGGVFYEEDISKALKAAQKAIERDQTTRMEEVGGKLLDNMERNGGQLSSDTVAAINHAAEAFAYRLARDGKVGINDRAEFNNDAEISAMRLGKTGKEVAKFAEKFKGMQLRPDVMFRQLGAWSKHQVSKFNQLAEDHKNAIKDKQNAQRTALEYFAAATQMKGYNDFASGKVKIKSPIPGYADSEMSLNVALCLLKTLETNGAIEHIARYGAQFAASEAELYNGKNNNGFGDKTTYGQTLSLLSEETQQLMNEAHTGEDIAHARAKAAAELKALAASLKAEVMKNDVAKSLYSASSRCMSYLARNINTTSQIMWGQDFANEGSTYFPMEWVSDAQKRPLINDQLGGLKGMGIVQEREGDKQPLRIRTFTDVMGHYIDQATDWSAFSDLSDRLELMSRTNPGGAASLAATIGEQYGKYYADWLENYVKDLNGTRGETSKGLSALRSNLASAALTLNAGVALKQSPSYWDAAGVIDMKYLIKHAPGLLKSYKSFENNALIQEVSQRTGMLDVRKKGGYEISEATENGRSLSGKVNKFMPTWMTNWITKTDVRTTSNLMLACADQVMDKNPGLKKGSNEYYKAIAAKFEEVILKTQPVYTKQARADYMRTTSETFRTLAMFRTQQTQNFNQLVEAIGEYKMAGRTEKKNAAKHLRQVVAGQATASVMFGILSAVAKAGLHKWDDFEDEEGKFSAANTAERIGLNTLGAMFGTVWFGGDVLNIGLDVSTGIAARTHNEKYKEEIEEGTVKKWKGLSESSDIGDSILSMVNDLTKYTINFAKNPSTKTFSNVVFSLSQVTGIPTRNLYNMINSATLMSFDVDRKMTGGKAWNDGSVDDVIRLFDQYKKQSPTTRTKATYKAIWRNFDADNADGAYALAATLDYSDDKVRNTAENLVKAAYLDPTMNLTTEQYKKLMEPIIKNMDSDKAANARKHIIGLEKTKDYYARTSEEQVEADKKAIDENGNGNLDQEELYKYYLLHPDKVRTVEALFNENEYTGENALWTTYIAGKQKYIERDRIIAKNGGNVLFDTVLESAKNNKKEDQVIFQKTDNDADTFRQIRRAGLSDKDTDTMVESYVSSDGRKYYNTLRKAGRKPSEAMDIIAGIDALGDFKDEGKSNGKISQAEMYKYYKANPESEEMIKALWEAGEYKTTWEEYKRKNYRK